MGKKGKATSTSTSQQQRRSKKNNDRNDMEFMDYYYDGCISESYTIADESTIHSNGFINHSTNIFGFDEDDNDDETNNHDHIIQRGDPGMEQIETTMNIRLQYIHDMIVMMNDMIHDKKQKSNKHREMYLRKAYKIVSLYATCCGTIGYDTIYQNYTMLIEVCQYTISNNCSPTEQYTTCRIIEVLSIIFSNDPHIMECWISGIYDVLRTIILSISTTRPIPIRMAALRTLSISIYMASICGASDQDGIAIEAIQDLCEIYITNHTYRDQIIPVSLRATAISCWSLLASTQDDWTISGYDDIFMGRGIAILSHLKDAIDDTDIESSSLRSCAGECLSLIHEARINLGVDTMIHNKNNNTNTIGDQNTMINATSRRYCKGSWDGSKFEDLIDEVKQRISDLANESSHHISKKDKKEQRANFREYMSTLIDDESPELVIQFRKQGNITLSSWKEIIPLNFLRHSLQSGFQTHLLSNPIIQQLFNIQQSLFDNNQGTMSQIEKRLMLSKTSDTYKAADQDRRKKRDKRENIKNHFITADGDDI